MIRNKLIIKFKLIIDTGTHQIKISINTEFKSNDGTWSFS